MQDSCRLPDWLATRSGVGFKPEHFETIRAEGPKLGFFEVHAENYMGAGGPPHAQLAALRENYPLSLHGVGLSIGAARPLDRDHLYRLKALNHRYEPVLFSEHLAWSSHNETFLADLLPLPYTQETLSCVADHVDEVQEVMGRRMLLENPATYVLFEESTVAEIEFLSEVARRTGCGLLLDINNVFVSAANHGTSAEAYLRAFPLDLVGEIHLAGHAPATDETGAALLVDAHDRPVADPVWTLYEAVLRHAGGRPTLIEWDNDVPAWPVLHAEAQRAEVLLSRHARRVAA
jgi:uncharacterized protein (UPF0276 family)